MEIKIELESNISDVLRKKLETLLMDTKNHNGVLRNSAQAVGEVLTNKVPRSDRPPSVHHLQDFEVSELGVIKWYGNDPFTGNYAQKVFYNKENHTFHVRYPGHNPQARWTEVLYDKGIMSQVERSVQRVLMNAADEMNKS